MIDENMVFKYIDNLTPEKKDRIIEAQLWQTGDEGDEGGPRCLVGHAENWSIALANSKSHVERGMLGVVGFSFDLLVTNHGLDEAVRRCKLRAGHPQPVVDQPTQMESRVAQPSRS